MLLGDRDAVVLEHRAQALGELGLGSGCQASDDGDVGTKVDEELGLLDPDVPSADHHQGPGQVGLLHRGGGRQVLDLLPARQVRDGRLGSGGHQVGARPQHPPIDLQRVRIAEAGPARAPLEAVGGRDVGVLRLPQPPDELILLLHHAARSTTPAVVGAPGKGLVSAPWREPAAARSVLGRDAPDIHAGATQGALLDQDDAPVGAASGDRGCHRRPARAHHCQVRLLALFHRVPPVRLPA